MSQAVENKNAMKERVIRTINRLNDLNDALLKAESDSDVGLTMLTFAEFVLRTCCRPPSDLLLGNSLLKLSCYMEFRRVAYGRR